MKAFTFFCLFVTTCFALSRDEIAFDYPSTQQEWEAQKTFYKENGYIWIKNFFSKEQVEYVNKWATQIGEDAKKKTCELIKVPEAHNPEQACRVEDLLSCYPKQAQFIDSYVTKFLDKLLQEPYVAFKDKLNFKWPGGGAFDPHQDYPAFELLAPREHVNVMVSIDPATIENGCLHVCRDWQGTFRGDKAIDAKLLEVGRAVLPYVVGGQNHGSIRPEYVEQIKWVPLQTHPSDLVIFSSFVPHYSEPNHSKSSRRAMFYTFNRAVEGEYRTAYYEAKRNDPNNPIFHFGTPTNARGK